MKPYAVILLLSFLAANLYSQPLGSSFHSDFEQKAFAAGDPLQVLLASDPYIDQSKYTAYLDEMRSVIRKLATKRQRFSEERFMEKVFYTLHRSNLDWYENYVSFSEIFRSGKYDCLTGTALFALILDELDIPYEIYEFDYHTFLIAKTSEGQFLFEATDPLNGFVKDPVEIDRRIAIYSAGKDPEGWSMLPVGSTAHPEGSGPVNRGISLTELAGLQYFNLAVRAFHEHDLKSAYSLINKAHQLYPSERIREMRAFFARSSQLISSL